jgi:HK97 family phage portal protein
MWPTPDWTSTLGMHRLVDTAWAAVDLNSSVLSAFPVYRLRNGTVQPPTSWMVNPDPSTYASWGEFCKQLFWDYHLGEAFVIPMATAADGFPLRFRVVPPWLVNIELHEGTRRYWLGNVEVTDDILHIRNISNTADAHGHGPLESAGARMTTSALLERYAYQLAETGGVPHYWIGVDPRLTKEQAADLLEQWLESRRMHAGQPAMLTGGATLNQLQSMSAQDMALLELSQFTEARIAVLLGVPPFLLGLPMAQGESMTYSNVTSLFDYHARSSLRPKAVTVMNALSGWLLPRGQSLELNQDNYTRPDFLQRAQAYQLLSQIGVLSAPEIRAMERFDGVPAASATTGAELTGTETPEDEAVESLEGGGGPANLGRNTP